MKNVKKTAAKKTTRNATKKVATAKSEQCEFMPLKDLNELKSWFKNVLGWKVSTPQKHSFLKAVSEGKAVFILQKGTPNSVSQFVLNGWSSEGRQAGDKLQFSDLGSDIHDVYVSIDTLKECDIDVQTFSQDDLAELFTEGNKDSLDVLDYVTRHAGWPKNITPKQNELIRGLRKMTSKGRVTGMNYAQKFGRLFKLRLVQTAHPTRGKAHSQFYFND